ncbi:helix-turn-helix domain-containing protein [Methanococcoides methylutens]
MKEFRARYDLTQTDLAKLVGVRRETILFMKKGTIIPLSILHIMSQRL